jgi:hypothetical protein
MPDSEKIGEEFAKLGIPHVIAFEQLEWHKSNTIDDVLTTYRYNFIYCFCTKFYALLVDQRPKRSVKEAFLEASAYVEQRDVLERQILMKDNSSYEEFEEPLHVRPVLINFASPVHDQPLFDIEKPRGDPQFIKTGTYYDISRARGLRIGI